MKFRNLLFVSLLPLVLFLCGCGVKGPPLPPVSDTPEASERDDRAAERGASPRPSPTPSPKPKSNKKR